MNVNQLARNQQMMYNFINRGTSGDYREQMKAQLSSASSLALQGKSADDSVSSMLQSMGISGMQGRTVREMAQYQVRVQNANASAANKASAASAASSAKQTSAKEAADTKQTPGTSAASNKLNIRERYTPISDKATKDMQKQAVEDAKRSVKERVKYTTGKAANDAKQGAEKPTEIAEERNKVIQEHLKEVEPSKRTAAYNTMQKVYENETDRLAKYIKEKTPDWNDWGDKFDTKILDDYKAGVNLFL